MLSCLLLFGKKTKKNISMTIGKNNLLISNCGIDALVSGNMQDITKHAFNVTINMVNICIIIYDTFSFLLTSENMYLYF